MRGVRTDAVLLLLLLLVLLLLLLLLLLLAVVFLFACMFLFLVVFSPYILFIAPCKKDWETKMTDIVQLHSIDCTSNNQSCGKFPRLFCETNFSILHHVECVYWLGYFNASVTMIMMQKQVDRPRKKEDGDAASRN